LKAPADNEAYAFRSAFAKGFSPIFNYFIEHPITHKADRGCKKLCRRN
jgi:hypothetical protein